MSTILSKKHILIDIETSGLKKHSDFIVCIGILYNDDTDTSSHIQFINKTIEEEKESLISFINLLKDYSHIYTFGGKSFDIPFILARCSLHNLDCTIFNNIYCVDIRKSLLKLSPTRLCLEHLLSFTRECTSTGKELAKICGLYHSSGETIYKSVISSHNLDELYSLLGLYEIYTTLISLNDLNCSLVSKTTGSNPYIQYDFIITSKFYYNFSSTYNNISICWAKHSNVISIKVYLCTLNLKKYLSPAKDYYYVLSQNQIIHRSIAQFIDKSDKRKVTKDECFISRQNLYVPLVTTYKLPCSIWYDESKSPFISFGDLNPEIIADQLSSLLLSK